MQSRVMCNSLCSVRVNIMDGQTLVAIGQKTMDRIRNIVHNFNLLTQRSNHSDCPICELVYF